MLCILIIHLFNSWTKYPALTCLLMGPVMPRTSVKMGQFSTQINLFLFPKTSPVFFIFFNQNQSFNPWFQIKSDWKIVDSRFDLYSEDMFTCQQYLRFESGWFFTSPSNGCTL